MPSSIFVKEGFEHFLNFFRAICWDPEDEIDEMSNLYDQVAGLHEEFE
jgi:hypothetical protein